VGETGGGDAGMSAVAAFVTTSKGESNAKQYSASLLDIPVPVCCQKLRASGSCQGGKNTMYISTEGLLKDGDDRSTDEEFKTSGGWIQN
jgi:hypothetical protein